MTHLSSYASRIDLPAEVVLPDPMICLAGANIWAALVAYRTGVFIPPPEFSQARLDGTYNSLVDTLEKQRNGDSKKKFYKLMNTLYLKVSQTSVATADASGSANSIICLDIDSD
ncbi:hypothetical protein K438DRAFT_1976540 [Mycena galopus ATCC 62051]|nr:hypothetical protein K438DRAFT_1976540 [Mycena galopus ATCC 62051]